MKKLILLLNVIVSLGIMMGCQQDKSNKSNMALIKATDPEPLLIDRNTKKNVDVAERIKKDIASFEEIYDVSVIKGKKETLVAYKVKHLQRFHMKKIEKRMNKLLDKKYPKENITVSSDYKIFLESIRLKEKMLDKNFSEEKAEKELTRLINLQQELT